VGCVQTLNKTDGVYMTTLKDQLIEIVKSAKILNEEVVDNEDITLGTIDKYLNESVVEKCKEVLGN